MIRTITVTPEHIMDGAVLCERLRESKIDGCRANMCPVALAALEAGINKPCVVGGCIRFRFWGKDRMANLPAEATRFVEDFDAGLPVKPFTFNVEFKL